MKNNTLAIALGALLVGGVAVAAYQGSRSGDDAATVEFADGGSARIEFAPVVAVTPVTEATELFATVIGADPLRETTTTSTPRQVCEDVVVRQQAPLKDPNRIAGTVAGALIGGLAGNQIGGGDGRRVATAAGAVGGAYAGRHIQQRQQQNRVLERVDRQCRTVQDSVQSSQVVAWNVTYRNPDGTIGTMRTGEKPGERLALGSQERTVGYEVTYRLDGIEDTVRMDRDPGERLPVIDGEVMSRVAAAGTPDRG